ncbi:D-alanyl-D-alanine carboxypeptidase family protein [Kitasatospora sp. SUK 42]|uniref:D-alanyl-D-alanine carboxypeptidase family protein n=1 Tax=Kitasatospora sp. SUK 42 TaxID=1588882 RepID=UPI001C31D024|nr:D-alanyl-D-alanine carboxypeptidase [Kitasatospora sp. SUK 42]MBV2154347.1 D-alanyl-D-alanine carboxypeptidase [Kitasatospora sp. SUK 42]
MPTPRHTFAHLCAAAASALPLLLAAPAASAAPDTPPPSTAVGGERLGRPGVQVAPLPDAPALPTDLTGQSWMVSDATSGDVLAAYNPHLRLPPASTLKILFADTVLPKFDRSAVHRVTDEELLGVGAGSSLVGIKENLDYQVEDLWRGVFLSSGNDAVHVLAHMNGGIQQTVTEMQSRAEALQAKDTRVVSPDGYDMDGQVSSAYDLSLFARSGLRNADFRMYCGTREAMFPGTVDQRTGQRGSFGIANTDRLLGKYPGLIGVKNGTTTNAGSTFVGAAERGGRTLLVTVMHPASYQKVYDETAELLDWGFAAVGKVQPIGRLVDERQPGGAEPTGQAGGGSPAPPPHASAADARSASASSAGDGGLGLGGWSTVLVGAVVAAGAAGAVVAVRRRNTDG